MNDFEVVDCQNDNVKFRYGEMTFVIYVIDNGRKIETPKRLWFENREVFAHISRLAKTKWAETHGIN